jgi:hypothetical protein
MILVIVLIEVLWKVWRKDKEKVEKGKEELGSEVEEVNEREEYKKCVLVGLCVFLTCDSPRKNHNFCLRYNGYSFAPAREQSYPGVEEKHICTIVFCKTFGRAGSISASL